MKKKARARGTAVARFFVSVGTHPQQFNRLLLEIDRLAGEKKIRGGIFAQSGSSTYTPRNFPCKSFLTIDEFNRHLIQADVVITHAGEGNIGICKNLGKKMVVMPRRKEYGEHTNNHQLELAEVVETKGIGLVAWTEGDLGGKLKEIARFTPAKVLRGRIPELLEEFVQKLIGE